MFKLKKVKLSDGSKPVPEGIPTMEGAMRLEADMVESIRSKLEVRREQERKRFHQFKEADESQWPNMNNMPKDITIDKSTYENKLVFLMSVEKARFRNPVIPDCRLELNIEAIRSHGSVWKYKGEAFVSDKKMADAQWSATMVDRK